MPDDIDAQIDSLLADYASEKLAQDARAAEALRARLEIRKERLLSREWKPYCHCKSCLRAILLKQPSLACPNSEQWWR
jgi:hypothetical protein